MKPRGNGRGVPRLRATVAAALLAGAPAVAGVPGLAAGRSSRLANYTIEATLDPDSRLIEGRQILVWRNAGGSATSELRFHLYWNAWRTSRSTWMLEDRIRAGRDIAEPAAEDWGYQDVESARWLGEEGSVDLTGALRHDAPDDGNPDDRTVLVVPLPRVVAPGESVRLEMTWSARVPRTFDRTGFRGDYFFLAHWFPALGVYEDDGWNCHQFHASTEFYSDFGIYNVSLTLPSEYVVGATGKPVERRETAHGITTHRYMAEDVHTFTWTASPHYVERGGRFEAPGLPPVDIRLLMQPEHLPQAERHLAATRATLEHYGRWFGPYPYPYLTLVDPAFGSGAGGMEYPTLFTSGTRLFNPFGGGAPEGVTIHETGHQFWYGVVGNDEFEHAWLDEGINSYADARVYDHVYGEPFYVKRYFSPPGTKLSGFFPLGFEELRLSRRVFGNRLDRYRQNPRTDVQAAPTYRYYPASAGRISYDKTALWLHTLENHLGWPVLREVLAVFFGRWQFRHPRPEDFFAVAEEVSGQDLTWFWDQVYFSSEAFDYEVRSVASFPAAAEGWVEGADGRRLPVPVTLPEDTAGDALYRSEVVVWRNEAGVFPVEVLLVFEDGSEVRHPWDGRDRWRLLVEERPAKLAYAEVDPRRVLLLDLDWRNNSRLRERRSRLPALKWASRWMLWLQDLLCTYSFFI